MKTMKGLHKFRERDSQQEQREDLSWAWGTEKPRVGVVLAKRTWSVWLRQSHTGHVASSGCLQPHFS